MFTMWDIGYKVKPRRLKSERDRETYTMRYIADVLNA